MASADQMEAWAWADADGLAWTLDNPENARFCGLKSRQIAELLAAERGISPDEWYRVHYIEAVIRILGEQKNELRRMDAKQRREQHGRAQYR